MSTTTEQAECGCTTVADRLSEGEQAARTEQFSRTSE